MINAKLRYTRKRRVGQDQTAGLCVRQDNLNRSAKRLNQLICTAASQNTGGDELHLVCLNSGW